MNCDVFTLTEVLVNQKRVNVHEYTVNMVFMYIYPLLSNKYVSVESSQFIFCVLFYMRLLYRDSLIFW
jgi:hypothetical protein